MYKQSNGVCMKYKKGSHCSYLIQTNIIFVTKYRERKFNGDMLDKMQFILHRECVKLSSDLVEFNGECNHVHMVVSYHPSLSISRLVNTLKSVTGREMKLWFPQLNQVAWRKNTLWSSGYFACSIGGAPIEVLRQYIEQQDRPH